MLRVRDTQTIAWVIVVVQCKAMAFSIGADAGWLCSLCVAMTNPRRRDTPSVCTSGCRSRTRPQRTPPDDAPVPAALPRPRSPRWTGAPRARRRAVRRWPALSPLAARAPVARHLDRRAGAQRHAVALDANPRCSPGPEAGSNRARPRCAGVRSDVLVHVAAAGGERVVGGLGGADGSAETAAREPQRPALRPVPIGAAMRALPSFRSSEGLPACRAGRPWKHRPRSTVVAHPDLRPCNRASHLRDQLRHGRRGWWSLDSVAGDRSTKRGIATPH